MTSYGFAGCSGDEANSSVAPTTIKSALCSEAKLGVLIVHGMGTQKPCFAVAFIEKLKARISAHGLNDTEICWKPVYWADILADDESKLWNDLSSSNDLRSPKTRQFVINSIGDALAYQVIPDEPNCTYNLIHERVHEAILSLRKDLGDKDKPIVVIAHSMGSVIMSDYIWDRQNPDSDKEGSDPYGKTPLERMETLTGFITFGSPIALYTLAYDKIYCVEFPPDTLPQELRRKAKWLNFYGRHDVLGWPLKNPRSNCYKSDAYEDKPIEVGGPFTWWNPLSHHEYWSDDNFTEPAAQYVAEILKLCP